MLTKELEPWQLGSAAGCQRGVNANETPMVTSSASWDARDEKGLV
jgi:hypothetical protein